MPLPENIAEFAKREQRWGLVCETHGWVIFDGVNGEKVLATSAHKATLDYAKQRHTEEKGMPCKFEIKPL